MTKAYLEGKGDMDVIMDGTPFAHTADEPRLRVIIQVGIFMYYSPCLLDRLPFRFVKSKWQPCIYPKLISLFGFEYELRDFLVL